MTVMSATQVVGLPVLFSNFVIMNLYLQHTDIKTNDASENNSNRNADFFVYATKT
jgi:hypothetical protein